MFWKKSKKIKDRKDLTVKEFEEWYRWWVQKFTWDKNGMKSDDNLPWVIKNIGDWIELPSEIRLKIEDLACTKQRAITTKGNAK